MVHKRLDAARTHCSTQLIFFSESWTTLVTKVELIKLIYDITTIDKDVLLYERNIRSTVSISRRMSWAARRITTRVEDRSYSLLGIFDINMPLLYGEGHNAFRRLQEEILKQTDDESLFANYLTLGYNAYKKNEYLASLLAPSPDCFTESGDIFLYTRDARLHARPEHIINVPTAATNKRLQLNVLGCPCTYNYSLQEGQEVHGWLMILNCGMRDDILSRPAVFLRQLYSRSNHFVRHGSELLLFRGRNKIMMFPKGSKQSFENQLDRVYIDRGVHCMSVIRLKVFDGLTLPR